MPADDDIGAQMELLEARVVAAEESARDTSRRMREAEASVQVLSGLISHHRRTIDEMSSRLNRLTDVASVTQLRLDKVSRNTERILAILEAAPRTDEGHQG